jgi:glyoxylase-like metal-dependent hydrolase (beta-lactamase superfamily II)
MIFNKIHKIFLYAEWRCFFHRIVIGIGLGLVSVVSSYVVASDCRLTDAKNFPATWKLPAKGVNVTDIPDMKLEAAAPDNRALPVYQLTNDTYFLFGNISTLNENNRGFNANAGFIVTSDGVVVIDTLGTPKLGKRLISTIRCVTDKPVKYLIVTHNHPDHAYGAAAFLDLEGINIIAHPGTVDYNHSATLETSVDYRREMLENDMAGFKPLTAKSYLQEKRFEKQRITVGNEIFDIYNTGRHHSYGDLVVHQVNQKILWISDLAFNQRTTFMGDGHSAQILAAQDWLLKTFKDIELMVPGHGSVQTAPFPMVAKTREYVTRMRDAMKEAVENGVSMLDAVQDVEFEDWRDIPLYEENQRANANFVYREMEKAFFENF